MTCLVSAARQIAINLSPIAKKINFFPWPYAIRISLERPSNYLACALQLCLCFFRVRFALLKTSLSNQNLT